MKYIPILVLTIVISCTPPSSTTPPPKVYGLTCEYVENPTTVDRSKPRLGWKLEAPVKVRGISQNAYEIRVASSKDKLSDPDLWRSGRVVSEENSRIEYNGTSLKSGQECWWQVRVWDQTDKASKWSEPATWAMGIMNSDEWKATWIGAPWQGEEPLPDLSNPGASLEKLPPPAPLLRKQFQIDKPVKSARAFVTGLGYFEFYLNGQKVGNDVLVPNQTNYGKRPGLPERYISLPDDFYEYKIMYLGYDITSQLRPGSNALGAILGNGFYNASKYWTGSYGTPRFFGQIHIKYEDGTEEIIASDPTWKVAKGPIRMDMVYYGERYDARLEMDGWSESGFDDSGWEEAIEREKPYGKLVAHTPYPDRIVETLEPIRIEKVNDTTHFVDFGPEISGWVRLRNVTGPAGHKIDISFNSNLYSGDNSYIFRGDGPENYAPRFNWFVFSAVHIYNWPGELRREHLVAEAVNTVLPVAAEFETSSPLLNDLNKIWRRSQLDNTHGGIASDCPHRERSGYTGDGQVACEMVLHNFDARSFYDKWIGDMRGAQVRSTGYVPNGAPWQPGCGGGVAWGAAIQIMPWEFYRSYGSIDMLKDTYPHMKEYIRYMQTWVDNEGIMYSQRLGLDGSVLKWFNLGDWACVDDNCPPDDLVHTFYFWHCVDITARAARVLGFDEEASEYSSLVEVTREAFWKRFYNEETGSYGKWGSNVFALKMGVPDGQLENVVSALQSNISDNDNHVHTGIFGTRYLFEVLSDNGLHELAYEIMDQRTWPSFGAWLVDGATTTREHWDDGGSHNHPMFGGGLTWYYKYLAGMKIDEAQPGYKRIIFKPQPAGNLDYAKYYLDTVYGKAGIHWKKAEDFNMKILVPVGTSAMVYVPTDDPSSVLESGMEASAAEGVQFISGEAGYALFEVSSGSYEFVSPLE